MSYAPGVPIDAFRVAQSPISPGYNVTYGRGTANPRGNEDAGVFIVAGQSNGANHAIGGLYIPTNSSEIGNLNFLDGGMYQGQDPALGASGTGGSWLFRFADSLISEEVYDRVVIVPIAVGGSSINDWLPAGILGRHLAVAYRRCAALSLSVTAVLWQQGESDHGMASATYQSNLQSVIETAREAGIAAPFLVGKSTYNAGNVDNDIRAACTAIVDGVGIFAGADTDALTGESYRAGDLTHFNAAGAAAAASLWAGAVEAALTS